MVLIGEYDGRDPPECVQLDGLVAWTQIHSIPGLQAIIDELAWRVSIIRSLEMNAVRYFEGKYVRVRASIEMNKPIIHFVTPNLLEKRGCLNEP